MKITLDENGEALGDTEIIPYVVLKLGCKKDAHVSNMIAIDGFRSALKFMPKEVRPEVTWEIYGKIVNFDDNIRSFDAYLDPRTSIHEEFLYSLL